MPNDSPFDGFCGWKAKFLYAGGETTCLWARSSPYPDWIVLIGVRAIQAGTSPNPVDSGNTWYDRVDAHFDAITT